MVYSEGLVCIIKVNGKVLRENKSIVYLPFGSEYSLGLKNIGTKKAQVKISIDGKSIGNALILDSGHEIDLERNLSLGNSGNKFRFIEKTEQISNYRGDRIDDGLIRIEYDFEKIDYYRWEPSPIGLNGGWDQWEFNQAQKLDFPKPFRTWSGVDTTTSYSPNIGTCLGVVRNLEGITVPGSKSDQKFVSGCIGQLEGNPKVIIIQLKGRDKDVPVVKPFTTRSKIKCETCGHTNKSFAKFCSNCGTSLVKY